MRRDTYREVGELHRHGSRAERLRLRGRALLCDMDLIERHVPAEGLVVDIGCGYGFFANLMARRSPRRRILGVDIDEEKIRHARASIGPRENIDFRTADVFTFDLPRCDAITILDITYLMPPDQQHRLLEVCRRSLKPGGKLVWKTQETRPRWKYAFMYVQEMGGSLIGMTGSGQKSFYFLSREEATGYMRDAGFGVEIVEMPTWLPYCEVLYLGS